MKVSLTVGIQLHFGFVEINIGYGYPFMLVQVPSPLKINDFSSWSKFFWDVFEALESYEHSTDVIHAWLMISWWILPSQLFHDDQKMKFIFSTISKFSFSCLLLIHKVIEDNQNVNKVKHDPLASRGREKHIFHCRIIWKYLPVTHLNTFPNC
jgi:hypothetical protein